MGEASESFSELLQKYMKRRNVSRKELAEKLGLGSVVFKYVKGTRTVPNFDIVEKMADYLQFSPADKKKLIRYWRTDLYGAARLHRWHEIDEFFSHFQAEYPKDPVFSFQLLPEEKDKPETGFLHSSLVVQQAILMLLKREEQRETGERSVWSVVLPEDRQMIECLRLAGRHISGVQIHHIMRLPVRPEADKEKKEPLSLYLLQSIQSLVLEQPDYHSYYAYSDSVSGESWPLNASFIVSHDGAVIYGEGDGSLCGVYSGDPHMVRYLRNLMVKISRKAHPFLERIISPVDLLNMYYAGKEEETEQIEYSYCEQPCLCPLISEEMVDKYIRKGVPESLKKAFLEDIQWYREKQKIFRIEEFSYISGLKRFLETGRMDEIPSELYEPFDEADRRTILKKWKEQQELKHQTHFMREDQHVHAKLSIAIWKKIMTISFENRGKMHAFYTEEQDLLDGFTDYFQHLKEDRLLTEDEETEELSTLLGF